MVGRLRKESLNRSPHTKHLPISTPRRIGKLVGLSRFELLTPRLSSVCSNQLSYRPSSPRSRHSPRFPTGVPRIFQRTHPPSSAFASLRTPRRDYGETGSFKTRQDVCCVTPGRYQIDLIQRRATNDERRVASLPADVPTVSLERR